MNTPGFTPLAAPIAPYGAVDLTPGAPDSVRTVRDLRDAVDPEVFVNAYTRPLPRYDEVFVGPGYEGKPARTSGFAVAALICGIAGVFVLVPALGAIAFGHAGIWATRRNQRAGRGLAVGGLVLGYGMAAMVALVVLAVWIADQ